MWKFNRSFVIPRWYSSNQWLSENKNQEPIFSQPVEKTSAYKRYQDKDQRQKRKERFKKQSERFWKCSQFEYLLSKSFLYDTAGWVGTATILCLKFHHIYFNSFVNHGRNLQCKFSKNVHAMVENSTQVPAIKPLFPPEEMEEPPRQCDIKTDIVSNGVSGEDFLNKATQYEAVLHNSTGLACLDTDSKKAFRSFQKAARLGSSQGFYNLGLCYETGKGTRVNLSRAAFCYQKAAMKGHGLASFNLAIYFTKGLGGLPVDPHTAKLLLTAAAEQDIPQAQLLLGLDCLEEEKWSDAFQIFEQLAKKDNLDGKYYLGLCYENGWGVHKNMNMAASLYSQNSAMGHSKSTSKLSNFYEEGLGGCELDLDLAMALCQITTDNEDGDKKETLNRLKTKRNQQSVGSLCQINLAPLYPVKSNMPTSYSFPKLTSFHAISKPNASLLSYLDLFTSLPLSDSKRTNPTFFVGDDLNLSPSSAVSCTTS